MTIDEAIEVLERALKAPWVAPSKPRKEAINLGIEALKRVKDSRCPAPLIPDTLLPGETSQ